MAKIQSDFKIYSKTTPSLFPHYEGTKDDVYGWLAMNTYGPDGFHVYTVATETYQDARQFLEENNPFVPKFYRMNPETDDLLPNGRHLANGMRVLVDSSKLRINMDEDLSDWQEDRALEMNRWCTIGALEVHEGGVRFIGVYDDGSKRMRNYGIDQSWLIKIDSIRDSVNVMTDQYQQVYDLVTSAMTTVTETIFDEELSDQAKTIKVSKKTEDTIKQILGIFR